jgi:four helix bundle protein
VRNYRDLLVWEKAHELTLAVYKTTVSFPSEERFGLTSQIRRASASIAANLAEGCGRRSDGEMARYVQIAMGSGAELSYHFLLAKDLGLIQGAEYEAFDARIGEIMRMLSALAGKLRNARAA